MAKVQSVLETESTRLQVLKDNAVSAVSDSRRLFDDINDDVLKNGTSDDKFDLVKTLYGKLAESEAIEVAADARLETYHSNMAETLSGRNDPEYMEWTRIIERVNRSNQAWKAHFIGELNSGFDTQADDWWDEVRNGSNRKSKWLAMEICHIIAYYDQYLIEAQLSTIFKVRPNNHNTKLALEKLIKVRVLTTTTDGEGADVYMFVATLQMHLQYESNSAIENSISKDLKQLYNEGHASIKKRKKKEARQQQW